MVSDVTISTALNQQANTEASTTALAEDFSQFLSLLTIQLQNQDPLSPMETTEFTNQLVAFTGVEQQINSNQKLDSLVALGLNTATSDALGYVGKNISYVSSEFYHDGQTPQTVKYSLNSEAASSTLYVLDESGDVVYEADAAKGVGQTTFTWDGSLSSGGIAEPGTYSISIGALDANDEGIGSTVVVEGYVSGIESQSGTIYAIVGERAVSLGNILNVSTTSSFVNNDSAITNALNYIGMDISYQTNTIDYNSNSDESTELGYELAEEADTAYINIYDNTGTRIRRDEISTDDGENSYTWNWTNDSGATVNTGEYTYTIDARDDDSNNIEYEIFNDATVTGIETFSGLIYLNTNNGSTIPLSDVLSISPNTDTTTETET